MAAPFEFSEIQANHILDMALGRLTRLGRADLEAELAKLRETIAELEAILADEGRLRSVIKDELGAIRTKYATPRRAEITFDPGDMSVEDLIDDEEIVLTMTRAGYVKAVLASTFRTQGRGGRGVRGGQPQGGGPGHPGHPHHRPRPPAVLLQPGQGVPAAGLRGARQGAHGSGHRRSSTCCRWSRASASRP